MKKLVILLVLGLCVPCFADTTYVKVDASLVKKSALVSFSVTEKMKTDALKLGEITEGAIKYELAGVGNRANARQVIEELLNEKQIIEKNARYAELYPSAELISP